MSNVLDYYPELADHFTGRPELEFWPDYRVDEVKLRPVASDRDIQIAAFAYWTVTAGGGAYTEVTSGWDGYVVSTAEVTIGGRSFLLEYYLPHEHTRDQYREYTNDIKNAVAAATAEAQQ